MDFLSRLQNPIFFLILFGIFCLTSCSSRGQEKAPPSVLPGDTIMPLPAPDSTKVQEAGLPVFPGASGFGIYTPAGRGGAIYRVTHLGDSGPGSLREALEASGPRTVLFEVGGIIDLNDRIEVENPFLTIAGQTAPGEGICLRGSLILLTHDILIQHLTIRQWPGEDYTDCLGIGYGGGYETNNIVVDHCSFSFGRDESVDIFTSEGQDITLSHCLLTHADLSDRNGYGALIRSSSGNARLACTGNIFAHNRERAPLVSHSMFFADNLIYDHFERQLDMEGDTYGASPAFQYTIVSNLFLQRRSQYVDPPIHFAGDWNPGSRVYIYQNYWSEWQDGKQPFSDWAEPCMYVDNLSRGTRASIRATDAPILVPGYRPWYNPDTLLQQVLAHAGARPAQRSSFDRAVIDGIREREGQRGLPKEFPPLPFIQQKLELPEDPQADPDGNGYTRLEEWLHRLAQQVESPESLLPSRP